MPSTDIINQLQIGMNKDTSQLFLKDGQYFFALNASIEDFTGDSIQLQNTHSNFLKVIFPSGYKVIGRKRINELNRTIFYLVDDEGNSEIGEIKDTDFINFSDEINSQSIGCIKYDEKTPLELVEQIPFSQYRTIKNQSCFNFSINKPIYTEYTLTNSGLNIYFVDDFNPIRYLYFDLDQNYDLQIQDKFKVILEYDVNNCNVPIYSEEIDCNKMNYNPDFERPCIEFVDDISGGSLLAGSYQAIVCYSDINGTPLSRYFPATSNIPIKSKNIFIDNNYETGKALYFKINNLDISGIFLYYNIVIASTINNFTSFKLVATLPISQNTYTYTGNDLNYIDLTSNDIFFERPIYKTAFHIGKANDYLFFSNLKEYEKINLQPIVNKVKLYWQTKAVEEKYLQDPRQSNRLRGYLRDEVYAFALVFELKDDNDTIAFHIPGPSVDYFYNTYTENVNEVISNDDVIVDTSCLNLNNNKKWQVYNTAKLIGSPHQQSQNCDDNNCWEWGDFAYWQSTQLYPNIPSIWGELCGKPIRHHKFPDSNITHFHDGLNATRTFEDANIVFPIGVKVDHNSIIAALEYGVDNNIITQEQLSQIKGYRLVRANRRGNESIVAKGLLYDVWKYSKFNNDYYYPNYPYNDLRRDDLLAPDDSTYSESQSGEANPSDFIKTGRYTFHSPNTHFTNPNIGTEIKLEAEIYGTSNGYFNNCEEQAEYNILTTTARGLCFAFGVASVMSEFTKTEREITTAMWTQQAVLGTTTAGQTLPSVSGQIATQYNTFGTPGIFSIGTAQPVTNIVQKDIRGTVWNWINPTFHPSLVSAGYVGATGFMFSALSIAGLLSFGAYFFTRVLQEMEVMAQLMRNLTPKKNPFIQYNSVGNYNSFKTIPNNGFKNRKIEFSKYLTSDLQTVNENNKIIRFNNWNRESSIYLKTDSEKSLFNNPSVIDDSRFSMVQKGLNLGQLNKNVESSISSFYTSIKNYKGDQYGNLYNLEYLETNSCSTKLNETPDIFKTYFGGDTFISRFALKRKHPFFLQTRFKQLDNADVNFSDLGNTAYPNYYFDFGESIIEKISNYDISDIINNIGGFFEDFIGVDDTRLDCKTSKLFYQQGYVHLYNYGIPSFLCESDINTYYRNGENSTNKDYYPNQQDLNYWLQEKNTPISEDNFYAYNKSYSKQNKESYIKSIKPNYKFNDKLNSEFKRRIINTEKRQSLKEGDNWLVLKANNYKDVNPYSGEIVALDGIEDEIMLVRTENTSSLFNVLQRIQTNTVDVQVGKGGLYEGIEEFSVTELGHMGSQNRDMIKTEFGHIWADARRGQIFMLAPKGKGIEEISRNGMKNWFKQNLPFQILKDFPTVSFKELDNNYKGVGLHFCYDKRFERIFLTKLDYKKKRNDICFNNGEFYIGDCKKQISCPEGYDLINGKCKKDTKILATKTANLSPITFKERKAQEYAVLGTSFYSSFQGDGTGVFENATNNFWKNIPQTSLTGPLNRCGVWSNVPDLNGDLPPINTWVTFSKTIDVPETKVYYVGIAADNRFRLKLGCNILLESNVSQMAINHSTNTQVTFKYWHVYPISLNKGLNTLELSGLNEGRIAVFGAEIYDNTLEELKQATSLQDLNILFTTDSLKNTTSDTFNYTCQNCKPVIFENDEYTCGGGIEEETPIIVDTNIKIDLNDDRYFEKKYWTLSYNFLTKNWTSFHSFTPNYYISNIHNFDSGLNDNNSTLWSHNLSNKSYQVYYGKLEPFILEISNEFKGNNNFLNSVEYIVDVVRYHNDFDFFYNREKTFNKAIVYNERQNSGLLNLNVKNKNKLSTVGVYPIVNNDSIDIEVSNSENIWRFNTFFDTVCSEVLNAPVWNYDSNNVDKKLNNLALKYNKNDYDQQIIRGKNIIIRFINDKESNYSFKFLLTKFDQTLSLR